ncbi:hypothetical protein ACGFJ7_29510 [Actinoplanes sp. NPDC048988]|uniref:hypothetical protein n=1 Tax=Actinoplanes sp. NPDC048988 TaxID=3363901 RepID=UPI0037190D41
MDLAEATDATAYLWRDTGYVAHDLATGRESLLLPMTGVFDGSTDAADGISTAVAFDRAEEPGAAARTTSSRSPSGERHHLGESRKARDSSRAASSSSPARVKSPAS